MEERTKRGEGLRGPALSRILMLGAGGFAVEAAYMIEEGYAMPAMLATGLPETVASAMWAVGPLFGLVFQGYLGSASDRCTCTWGKRRPFIVALAVCAFLATLLFPYGSFLSGSVLRLGEKSGGVFVMLFTAFTFVAMDFFLDALQSPLRAYLIDSVPAERSERANYTYTTLLCAGAIAGSLIAGVPWSSLAAVSRRHQQQSGGEVARPEGHGESSRGSSGGQLEMVYGIATAVFAVCMLVCVNSVKETNHSSHRGSPRVEREMALPLAEQHILLENGSNNNFARNHNNFTALSALKHSGSLQPASKDDLNDGLAPQPRLKKPDSFLVRSVSPIPLLRATPTFTVARATPKTSRNGCFSRFVSSVYDDLCSTILFSKCVSPHFSRLCLTVFFSWVALLSMLLYFTSFMGQVVYGGSPYVSSGERERELFDHGVQVGFLIMLFQDFISAGSSLSMKCVSKHFGIKRLLVGVPVAYMAASFLAASMPSLLSAILLQLVAGLMYSNFQSLPYTLLSHYEEAGILLSKPWPEESETTGKAISLLCMMMFFAQFLVATSMGCLIHYSGTHRVTLFVSFGGSCLAALTSLHLTVPPSKKHTSPPPQLEKHTSDF